MTTIKKFEVRSKRVPIVEDPKEPYGKAVHAPTDVAIIASALLDGECQEVFLTFALDVKNRVLGYTEAARGGVDACAVYPREVFRSAVMLGASGVIVVHNHPSGDPTPSTEDKILTRKLKEAGSILGIQVLDHVIVGDGGEVFSFVEKGLL